MKKFLSLALALIMTLSLVTISAGATEYKDLTDKDEIQYEEAVAVLNRLGIITGYAEGDFRPQGELTRGAAAKIIVSLLIGAEAAEALPKDSSPYPDVPAGSTFAGVISYCKNMKIIDGYGDGTFRSTGTLTGYAFSKMLLGILGYDGKQEGGFTGAGWTTNVARVGHQASLFDRITFNGGETVNRETACQLALNTLKATEVEYTGGMDVVVGDTQINAPKTRTFKTSNQEWASHISSRRAGYNMGGNSQTSNNIDNHYTVEFGEEHFQDLRMDHDRNTHDQFGRPANEWSYKKVTIGTFALEPDFVYTTQVAHNVATTTSAAKVRALELNGYDLEADDVTSTGNQEYTNLWLNGALISEDGNDFDETKEVNGNRVIRTSRDYLTKVADIADYTDNGTLVEVYVDDADADFIRDVVVIKTQLMEVRSQKSEAVSLKLYDDSSDAEGGVIYGYNQSPIDVNVNDVEVNDDLYATLKDKKAGDIVAVVPVWADSRTKYDVAEAYTPETVSGSLTRVDTYGNVTTGVQNYVQKDGRGVISATVGGTEYKVALWNKNLYDIDGTSIRVTRKDVTLYMDVYGNAMLATDVGATSNFMVVAGYHSGLVNGRVVTYVDGYDINGNEISLNVGNHNYAEGELNNVFPRGNLVHYKSNTSSNYAEWDLDYLGVFDVASLRGTNDETNAYSLRASNSRVLLNGWEVGTNAAYKSNDNADNTRWSERLAMDDTTLAQNENVLVDDAGVKFIYVTIGDDGEVDSVEIKNGMQNTTNEEILGAGSGFAHKRAQACVALKNDNKEVTAASTVKAVVIKQDSSSANLSNLLYIHNYAGSAGRSTDNQGRIVYGYEVKFIGASDWRDTETIYSYKNLLVGDFARYRKATEVPTEVQGVTEDNFYTLNGYDPRTNVALSVSKIGNIADIISDNKTLLRVDGYYNMANADIHNQWRQDTQLDLGDELANDIVSINGAKIIDLTGNDVENPTDLKDLWDDVTEAQKAEGRKRVIEIAMLYNDKQEDDEFRDVYVLVIRKADPAQTYIPAAPAEPTVPTITITIGNGGANADKVTGYIVNGTTYTDLQAAANAAGVGGRITFAVENGFKAEPASIVVGNGGTQDETVVISENTVAPGPGPVEMPALNYVSGAAEADAPTLAWKDDNHNAITVTGLGVGFRVIVLKADGTLGAEFRRVSTRGEADGEVAIADGDKLVLQKGAQRFASAGDTMGLVWTFEDADVLALAAGEAAEAMISVQNAPADAEAEFTAVSTGMFVEMTFEGVVSVVEICELYDASGEYVGDGWRFKADTTDLADAVDALNAALDGGKAMDELDIDVTGNTEIAGFVNLVDAEGEPKSVSIPVDGETGEALVEVEVNEDGTEAAITVKEGVTVKIGDEYYTSEDVVPTVTAETPDLVVATPEEVAGVPFKLSVSTKAVKYGNGPAKMPSDLSDDLAVTYDEATKTFKLTGTLKYIGTWDGFGAADREWFADLTVEQTDNDLAKVQYKSLVSGNTYRTVTGIKGSDIYEDGTGNTSPSAAAKLSNNITISIATQDDLKEKVYLKTVDKAGREEIYDIDLSGLTLDQPDLITFSAVTDETVSVLNPSKKISDIQSGVKVEVTGSDSVKNVKVTGKVYPVTTAWTGYQAGATGYFVAIHMDASALGGMPQNTESGDKGSWNNPNNNSTTVGIDKVDTGKTNSGIVVIKVADLNSTPQIITAQAKKTMGGVQKLCVYTIDFSGLELVQPGATGDTALTVSTGSMRGSLGATPAPSDLQDITITKRGDTFFFTGSLKATDWSSQQSFWGENYCKGYYVDFDVDVSAIAGATAWSLKGAVAGNCPATKDEMVYLLASLSDTALRDEARTASLYVLDGTHGDQWGTAAAAPATGCIKTYTLDFSGITLEPAEPFTVEIVNTMTIPENITLRTSMIQTNASVSVDHTEKTITFSGDLQLVTPTVGANGTDVNSFMTPIMGAGSDDGYFIAFRTVAGASDNKITGVRTSGVDGLMGTADEGMSDGGTGGCYVIIRVAHEATNPVTGGYVEVKTGEDEWTRYNLVLDVTFSH